MKIRLFETAAAVLFGFFVATPVLAQVVCETGRISMISGESSDSKVIIKGDSYTNTTLDRESIGQSYGTAIWETDSKVRWLERYTILKMAYATRSFVRISSSDNNCAGNQDEFTVLVCVDKKDCDY